MYRFLCVNSYMCRTRISHPKDDKVWQQLLAIKHHILRHMDSYTPGVRICCIKYVQKVVQTQSPGVIADPRVRYYTCWPGSLNILMR